MCFLGNGHCFCAEDLGQRIEKGLVNQTKTEKILAQDAAWKPVPQII